MNRDTLKTLAGLLIIGVIVVATFMYGNAQRKAQLQKDQEVKQQQANATKSPLASSSATPSPTASVQPTTGGSAQANTAPVQSPSSSNVQGGNTGASAATPAPRQGQVAGAATTPTPAVAAANSNLPETGPEEVAVFGAFGILGAAYMLRRSKKALYKAVRTPR